MRATPIDGSRTHVSLHARVAHVLTGRRWLRLAASAYLLLLVAVWLTLLAIWLTASPGDAFGADFAAFYTGGRIVWTDQADRLYDVELQQAIQHTLLSLGDGIAAYINPPHYALLLAPLGALPYPHAFAIWSLLMFTALASAVALLATLVPTLYARARWIAPALAILSPPAYFAWSAGQNSGLSVLLHVAALVLLTRRRDLLAGLVLALGLFKPQLFVIFVPLLLLAHRPRAVVGWLIGAAGAAALNLWWFGGDALFGWIDILRSPMYHAEITRQAASMFSWQSFWLVLIGPGTIATVLGWTCSAAVIGGLGYCWWRARADLLLCYALAVGALVVIGPHVFVYDLALLIIPVLILIDRVLRAPVDRFPVLRIALVLLCVMLLFAAEPSLKPPLLIVPLVTIIGVGAARRLALDPAPAI